MKCILSILLCLLVSVSGTAQEIRCYTTEMQEQLQQQGVAESDEAFERWIAGKIAAARTQLPESDLVIPVVVHIIYQNPSNVWNISDDQVLSQIQILNEDFQRLNPDTVNTPLAFQPAAVNTGISFCLAQRDPHGNPTTGIIRHQFPQAVSWSASGMNSTVKPATIWDPTRYMNVWVANLSGGLLGFAQFPTGSGLPGLGGGGGASTDGIVCLYSSVGRPPFNPFGGPYNGGRTATHEIGHYLGLRHIWGDGGCSADDFCADTPPSDASNYGCPTTHTSCGSVDMVQNYMDYTNDACMNLFTADQTVRMITVLQNSPRRASLVTASSCLTAILAPVAAFSQTADTICPGSTVSFSDLSQNQPDSYFWSFPGGLPASDTVANPSNIRYDSSGVYDVSLIVTNATASDTFTITGAVVVNAGITAVLQPFPTYCLNDGLVALQRGQPRGGVYSGPGVVSDSLFNPAIAGLGTHSIVYSLPGCGGADTASLLVEDIPQPQIQLASQSFCLNEPAVNLTAAPVGGQFNGAGVTGSQFDPQAAGVGTHTVYYSFTNAAGCTNLDSVLVVVNQLPVVTLPSLIQVCSSQAFFVPSGVSPAGGSWSGPGMVNDTLFPSLAGAGTHVLTYLTPPQSATSCTNTGTVTLIVTDPPVLTFTPVDSLCVTGNNILMNQASISGGSYTGPGVSFGIFNPSSAGVGTHTIQYVGSRGGCDLSGSFTIQVFEAPEAVVEAFGPDSLRSGRVAEVYRWYFNGQLLSDATSRALRPMESGVYTLELEQRACRSAISADYAYFMTSVSEAAAAGIRVYPNPSAGLFRFERDAALEEAYALVIRDVRGRVVQRLSSSASQLEIDLSGVEAGLYLLQYRTATGVHWLRLVKQ